MSLLNKQSLYDRNQYNYLGPNVGTALPSDSNFFTTAGEGTYTHSPVEGPGGVGDHMVDLLTSTVMSSNHPYIPEGSISYSPSPNQSPFQDLDGATDTWSGQVAVPSLGQFGGPYSTTGPIDGFY